MKPITHYVDKAADNLEDDSPQRYVWIWVVVAAAVLFIGAQVVRVLVSDSGPPKDVWSSALDAIAAECPGIPKGFQPEINRKWEDPTGSIDYQLFYDLPKHGGDAFVRGYPTGLIGDVQSCPERADYTDLEQQYGVPSPGG